MHLETPRLIIRPFEHADAPAAHRILCEAFDEPQQLTDAGALAERQQWLAWSALSDDWLARMHQAPYGDRAVVLKATGALIGVVGYVALLDLYDQIPELRAPGQHAPSGFATPEVGLFWAIEPAQQRRGYATEAAAALIENAFRTLRLRRLLATTEYANLASQAVMRRLGMTLTRNPFPTPAWLQVVGILHNR